MVAEKVFQDVCSAVLYIDCVSVMASYCVAG